MNKEDKELIKQNKFRKLVNIRTNRLLKEIKLLSNLSDKRHYSYTDSEYKYLKKIVDTEMSKAWARFENKVTPKFKIEESRIK